jgi:glycosyltransferase involved in cell wall biosynthesis
MNLLDSCIASIGAPTRGRPIAPPIQQLPKLLFCTYEIPQSVNAGSMQLYRTLQDYPADRLMVLGMAPEADAKLLACRYVTLWLLTYRLVCTRFRRWVTGINSLNVFPEPGLAASERRVRDFAPDVVVTVMDKLSFYKHAWALSQRLGAPLVTITMDDPQTFEVAHPLLEGAFVRFLRRMYADAALSLGVSHEMCDYLKEKFGKRSEVFYFGPPEHIWPRAPGESAQLKSPPQLTLGYAGSMSLGYRDGILAILPALEATGTKLVIYTREQHQLIDHPLIANRGFVPPEQLWPAIQAECDAVILPYSFKEDIARVYRTHFPTKLSEHCWTGMPMIFSGPDYGTAIRWARQHPDAALTSTSANGDSLVPILRRLRDDDRLRMSLAAEGARVAREEFDGKQIRRRFAELLRAAAATASHRRH